jgi:hypothetical protein
MSQNWRIYSLSDRILGKQMFTAYQYLVARVDRLTHQVLQSKRKQEALSSVGYVDLANKFYHVCL